MVSQKNRERVNSIPLPSLIVNLHIPHALQLHRIFIQEIQINVILNENGGNACRCVHAQTTSKCVNCKPKEESPNQNTKSVGRKR